MHRSALGIGALSDDWARERLPAARGARRLRLPGRRTQGDELAGVRLRLLGRVRAVVDGCRRALADRGPARDVARRPRTSRSGSCTSAPPGSARASASQLLAQLLTRQPHDRAVLSTQTGSRKARRFYAKNGWGRARRRRLRRRLSALPRARQAALSLRAGSEPAQRRVTCLRRSRRTSRRPGSAPPLSVLLKACMDAAADLDLVL